MNKKIGITLSTAFMLAGLGMTPAFAASNTVTVQPGNTFWTIANANGISVQALETANPNVNPNNMLIGTVLQLPGTGTQTASTTNNSVKVQAGNTFWTIANTYGVTVQALEAANPNVNPNNLIIGSVLQLPSSSAPATPSNNSSSSSISQQNLYWMEHVINAEAGGESLQAQIAVGDVILHRVQSGYGSTVQDVVFQVSNGHYQFTCVANGYIYTTPSPSSIQAAQDVLNNREDIVPGALVFYNPAQTPATSWVRTQPIITQIDNLVFAR